MYITTSGMADILMLKSNYNPHQSREITRMMLQHLSFLLHVFESGFRYSRNGGCPVTWIISL